tara:strand:- start:81418 stop:83154 length:1737 start_codon:yes stop_codon:yes gene_type:complete
MKNFVLKIFFTINVILFSLNLSAQSDLFGNKNQFNNEPLKVEEAFNITIEKNTDKNNVFLFFDIKPNHYLYESKLLLKVNGNVYKNYDLDTTEVKDDLYSTTQVMKNSFFIKLPQLSDIKNISLKYQGCSPEFSICYPVQHIEKTFNEKLSIEKNNYYNQFIKKEASKNKENNNIFDKITNYFKNTINDSSYIYKILLFFIIGVIISFTPCILPMIPIVSSIVVSEKNVTKKKAFYLSFLYVIGSALAYAMIGAISALTSKNLQIYFQDPIVIVISSIVLFIFALSMFDLFQMNFLNNFNNKINNKVNKVNNKKGIGVVIIGFLSSLIVSPCVAAPLASIILYTSSTGEVLNSAIYLFFFGLGLGAVLIIVATSLNKIKPKTGSYMNIVKYFIGFVLIIVSIYLLDRIIDNYYFINFLYTFSVIFLGYYLLKYQENKKIVIFIIALLSIIRIGINYYIEDTNFVEEENKYFEVIENKEQVFNNQGLTIIKITADWCVYCQRLDKNVFTKDLIENNFQKFKLLSLDLTEIENFEEVILKQYNIVGPPSILILKDKNVVFSYNGEIEKSRLLEKVKEISK